MATVAVVTGAHDASMMLNPLTIRDAARQFIAEDIPNMDVGGSVVGCGMSTAQFLVKSKLVIAGFPFAEAVLKELQCTVTWNVREGEWVEGSSAKRIVVGRVEGPANRLLQAERTALELLARCSACATYARRCIDASKSLNPSWKGTVAATRKTTPGTFRMIEKYGAIVGGADPHRYSLSSMVMLKDNHVDIAGNIRSAVRKARSIGGFSLKIEVECRSVEDAIEAAEAGADVLMLDNFSPDKAAVVAPQLKQQFPHVLVELSGGVTVESVAKYAVDGVDVVSVGLITHGPPPTDISMKIKIPSKL